MNGSRSGLSGTINTPNPVLGGGIKREDHSLNGNVSDNLVFYAPERDIPSFDGPYEVKPAMDAQTLETVGMLMQQDVIIEQIPIYVVSNNSGGTTVTIGG